MFQSIIGQKLDHPPSRAENLYYINNAPMIFYRLVNRGLVFKIGEADELLYKVLTNEIDVKDPGEMISFICQNGCNLETRYQGGNT